MINASDIQILDAKQQAGSEPRSAGVNSNFLSRRFLNPVAPGFKIDTNAIKHPSCNMTSSFYRSSVSSRCPQDAASQPGQVSAAK